MKKLFAILLAMMMVLSMASFAMADEPIEITIWHSWGSGANNEAMEELVRRFNEAYEGKIHATAEVNGSGYAALLSKFNQYYGSNENPTVSIIDACMSLNETASYGSMECLSDWAANDPDYDMGEFMPAMLVFSTDVNGKVWSFPYARSTQMMYGNMEALAEVGYDHIPATWEEMWDVCEKWVALKGTPAYGHPIAGGYFTYYITVWGGGEYFSKDGEGACRDLNDGWRKALTAWREAIDKGWYFVPSQTTGNHWDEFLAGKMPFCFHSSGNLGNAITKSEGVFTLGVAPLAGKTMEDGSIYHRVYTGGANLMLSANKSEEEKKAGWELIKFMTSKESNIWHSLKTGYVLSHVGVEDDPDVQAAWAEQPFKKVAFDQLQWLNETHVSAHMSDVDNELVKNLEAFASSDMSVDEMLDNLTAIMEENLPNGIVDSYE